MCLPLYGNLWFVLPGWDLWLLLRFRTIWLMPLLGNRTEGMLTLETRFRHAQKVNVHRDAA
jgi:hypothetical protein